MCGTAGFYAVKGFKPDQAAAILKEMNLCLKHRGPDDSGIFIENGIALGMTRLSIVDLAGGHQPLFNEDESLVIVANGEIYNAPALRETLAAEGHCFKTKSDIEVILHLYEKYGTDCFSKLYGMFGLALWDRKNKTLFLARDRLGIKPLFYGMESDRYIFASEMKGLFPALQKKPLIRLQSVWDYLTLGYIPAPYTIYENIFKLLPGHYLQIKSGIHEIHPYWTLKPYPNPPKTQEEACEQVYQTLKAAVKSHLMSDVPLGVLLSGGLDSSALVAVLADLGVRTKTFSLGFEEESYNELPAARIIAKQFNTEHHEAVLTASNAQLLLDLLPHFDEPFQDSSCIPVYLVSRLAQEKVKVVLSGEGGDELFGGYFTYQADKLALYYQKLPAFLRHSIFPSLAGKIPSSDKKLSLDYLAKKFIENADGDLTACHIGWKTLFSEDQKKELLKADGFQPQPTLEFIREKVNSAKSFLDPLNSLLYLDTQLYLPDDLLTKVDRMSMAVSLEVRVPFLDHQISELLFSLPFSYKLKGLTKKYLLKKIMKDKLPKEILKRKKGGFSIPLAKWLKEEPLKTALQDLLSEKKLKQSGFFSPGVVQNMIQQHLKKEKDLSRQLWSLLAYELWHEQYLKTAV
jgi:asparagine synthase (glutamine-hydrolysing)